MVYRRICKIRTQTKSTTTHTHADTDNTTLLVVKTKVSMGKIIFWEYTNNDFYFRLVKWFK